MSTLKKLTLSALVGAAALTAGTANAAITLEGANGWEFSVGGLINQFFVYTDDSNGDDISEVRDGLLPAFLNFDMKAPTMNGLDIAAHISFSPSTNGFSYGGAQEQREVYFTVDGGFGQILMGKALGLYASHNILTDQTLFGVGYGTGGNGQTTLGGIGLGYDYADWRSQIKWTSRDMSGFKVAFAIMDPTGPAINLAVGPTGPIGASVDSEDLRYETDFSYAAGNYMVWLSGMYQKQDNLAEDKQAWTIGGTATYGGFQFMGQYSDSEDAYDAVTEAEWDQFIVQAGYKFGGATLVSAQYTELEDKNAGDDDTTEKWTLGVYHDVNANLKLVAEYSQLEHDDDSILEQDIFSLGAFVFF